MKKDITPKRKCESCGTQLCCKGHGMRNQWCVKCWNDYIKTS